MIAWWDTLTWPQVGFVFVVGFLVLAALSIVRGRT